MTETPPWIDLLVHNRWAALGTIDDEGSPFVSSVAFAPAATPKPGMLMHLSQLGAHTRFLQSRSASSLLVAAPDHSAVEDPQTLPRLTLVGESMVIPPNSESFPVARGRYLDRFPDAKMRFEFSDFHLFQFIPKRGNFVGGFGTAGKINSETIETSLRNTFT